MTPCVLFLYSYSDTAAQPWLDAGYWCVSVDLKRPRAWSREGPRHFTSNLSATSIELRMALASEDLRPALVVGFPPCTDLAVSGARHFAAKRARNPAFQREAMELVHACTTWGCAYIIENPVSVISTLWRKPDAIVHPWHFGGHIPEAEAVHPRWPKHIALRDHYRKATCLWLGRGARAPIEARLSDPKRNSAQWGKLGGSSEKTKEIRSETPRGLAKGIFLANEHLLRGKTFEHWEKIKGKDSEKQLTLPIFSRIVAFFRRIYAYV